MSLKKLQEEKNALAKQVQERANVFQDQGQQWKDAEERKAWETLNADYDAKNKEVTAAREAADIAERVRMIEEGEERSVNDRIPGREDSRRDSSSEDREGSFDDETYGMALSGWLRTSEHATPEERAAMKKCGLKFSEPQPAMSARFHAQMDKENRRYIPSGRNERRGSERRDLSTLTGSGGGYTVPTTLQRQLEVNMLKFGGVRNVAGFINTSTGEPFEWPTFDDTTNTGSDMREGDSAGAATDPTMGKVIWNSYPTTSGVLKVSYTLLRDSAVDLATIIGDALGTRLGRRSNTKLTTGPGGANTKGIITAASSGATTASPTALTFLEIMSLIHSVDPSYRNEPGAGFMCHDNILLAVRQLVDSQNRPLYVSGLVDGMPDKILGYNVEINQDMASGVTATAKTMLFGALQRYKIRRVGPPRIYRMEEKYRDEDKTGFVAFIAEDGNLLDAGTKPIKYLTQHA